uniref:Normal mucosa of esophagus-specific gene 1 protein n=1 Tax=Periophthalmus magnuspinnatus TaxID=409849 RepID=A0A3B3ZFJ1_9GOBI
MIPLIGFMAFAAAGATTASLYFLFTKTDIINKSGNPEPWEQVDPTKPQKLLTIHQQWKPIEELQALKKLQK